MGFFRMLGDYGKTLVAALGYRRYVIANSTGWVAALVLAGLAAIGVSVWGGQWVMTLAITSGIALWVVLGYANKLRSGVLPNLELDDVYIDTSPVRRILIDKNGSPIQVEKDGSSKWIKMRARNSGTAPMKNCRAYLTALEYCSDGENWKNTE